MLSFDIFFSFYRKDAKTQRISAPLRLCGKINLLIFILLSFHVPSLLIGQNNNDKISIDAFQRGEYLKYRLYYDSWATSWLTAGYGTMEIDTGWASVNGQKAYHITVKGNSAGVFNMFYKVRDRFESFMDEDELISLKFIRYTREGKYKRDDVVLFDHQNLKANSTRAVKDITPGIQDIVSAFYHMRTWDYDTAEINDEYFMDFFLDDSLYHSKIIFLGRETVRTEYGDIDCLKFKPQVAVGEIFQEPYPMELWVSDDENKIPIIGKSGVYIGSVTLELVEFKGLRHPLKTDDD
jgi:hypothetical protein